MICANYGGGGADRCGRELFDGICTRGAEARLYVNARKNADPPNVQSICTIPERALGKIERRYRRPFMWRHFGSRSKLAAIPTGAFDVLHLHNMQGGYLDPRAIGRLGRRLPFVWTLHDEWATTLCCNYDLSRVMPAEEVDRRFGANSDLRPGTDLTRRYRAIWEPIVPVPAAIISPSHYIAGLVRATPRYQGVQLYTPPDGLALLGCPRLNDSRTAARAKWGIPPDARVILLIANHLWS